MNIEQKKEIQETIKQIELDITACGTRFEGLKTKLAEYKSELQRELEESKVKTKYAIGEIYNYIDATGSIYTWIYKNDTIDKNVIAMGNDAATEEEAERIIRRRKAVVGYNAIVDKENGGAKFTEHCWRYYIKREYGQPQFFAVQGELAGDLKGGTLDAQERIRAQLTPELINDLFI